jgi:hypothetical protein
MNEYISEHLLHPGRTLSSVSRASVQVSSVPAESPPRGTIVYCEARAVNVKAKNVYPKYQLSISKCSRKTTVSLPANEGKLPCWDR